MTYGINAGGVEGMTLIISKNSIEDRIKRERRENTAIRRQEDVLKGLTRSKDAQRGDFKEAKQYDKIMQDYRTFKNPKDREKIKAEYFGVQMEKRRS